ncbi:sugar ABC transporter substrate-binding protein [Fervidobacterium islandicum]|uniref:Sugar ABC transporter substrate-binding protein n=1 Tax=Fervidobacterium islandicum TaxID=2423 RepID=A0AAJ5HNW7_FERIS|nr:sugar ABC transporter substrate-binding protein [Fervidobacterium islandicum]UOE96861.1 sugar ABC transporter substrate-binding protein [Fervidobacterium islandicum]
MKKVFLVLLVLITAIGFAKTITLEFWTLSLSPTFDEYLKAMIADFEKNNPGIKINWLDIPYASAVQKLTAAIAAGQGPDVVNLNTTWAVDFAIQGAILPIDNLIPPVTIKQYWEKLWNATVVNGKAYAFPWYASIPILMYNKDLFKKAGLDPNKPPKTWDEVLEYSRIIRAKLDIYGFEPNIIAIDELLLEGVPIVTPDGKKAAFNTPEAVARLEWFQKAYRENLMPRSLGGYGEGREFYQQGKIVMYPAGLTMLKHIEVNSPNIFKVTDVAPHPVGKAGIIKVSLMNLVIPVTCKYPKEAAKFAAHVTSPKWQIEFSKYATVLPSTVQGLETSEYFRQRVKAGDLNAKAMYMASLSMKNAVDLNAPSVIGVPASKLPDVRKVLQDYWMKAIKGELTAKEALSLAEKEVNAILAK